MATYAYDDFRVTFAPGLIEAEYPVTAIDPDGVQVAGTFRMPLTAGLLERVVRDLARGATRKSTPPVVPPVAPVSPPVAAMSMSGAAPAGGSPSPADSGTITRDLNGTASSLELDAAEVGGRLCDALLSGAVGVAYAAAMDRCRAHGRGLRLTLSLGGTPELLSVPWELLYRRPQFFASQRHTPLVRHLATGKVPSPPSIDGRVRILGVIASPGDLASLDVVAEKARIDAALAKVVDLGRVTIDWLEPATPRSLRTALRDGDYHVLHYVGHSDFTGQGEGVLFLEGDGSNAIALDGTALANLLADQRHLRLVVLNSCEGARTTLSDPFAGVATTLVSLGVPAVVAMQFEISDDAAILFGEELYTNLIGRQDPIDAAVAEARKAIYIEQRSLEFATPVLFLADPDLALFEFEVAAAPLPPPPPPGASGPVRLSRPAPLRRGGASRAGCHGPPPPCSCSSLRCCGGGRAISRLRSPPPVGDWQEGLAYNFGVVTDVIEVEGHDAVTFDQVRLASEDWTGFRESTTFEAEPVVAWWPPSQVVNMNPLVRTFVLADDVESLALDTTVGDACSVTDGSVDATWERIADVSAGVGQYASLTFSDAGLVERIRFTAPCPR